MKSIYSLFLRNVAVAVILPLLALGWYLYRDLEATGRQQVDHELTSYLSAVRELLGDRPAWELQPELQRLHRASGIRVTVIARDGTVLADSEQSPAEMENHLRRPEIQQALAEGMGRAERESHTVERELRYVAVTDRYRDDAPIFRAAAPLLEMQERIRRTQATILFVILLVLLFSSFIALRLSRRVAAPLEALSEAASRFATGGIRTHVIPNGPDAIRQLGETFNAMVERLDAQMRSLDETQGYLDTLIRQMPEGLLVIDSGGLINRANAAAEELLGTPADRMLGRPILSVLFSYALDMEVRRVLEGHAGCSLDVRAPDGRWLRVTVGPLMIQRAPEGVVVLLQDVTELRRADDMRRDFVANVSHELRTPIAAIRALVETMMLRGKQRPELLEDYGPRVVHECERIDHLVQDLLTLAQTESGYLDLQRKPVSPREMAESVLRQVEPLAAASGTKLRLGELTEVRAMADQTALEQCLRNLVDNALRYAVGSTVTLSARQERDQVVFQVADTGPGIPPEDLPRIFERFYRVDKARSREAGGSGLGLSIVRHMMEAQGGRAWVESRVGQGTTFFLALAAAPPLNVEASPAGRTAE